MFTSLLSTTIMELNAAALHQMVALAFFIPLVLKKLRLYPALTAGPFIATVIDAVGITIYFRIAVLLLNRF